MKSLLKLIEEELISHVIRPVGRMLFPDRVGYNDDSEYFAFTIRYDGIDVDVSMRSNANDDGTDGYYDVNVHSSLRERGSNECRGALARLQQYSRIFL